MKGILFKPWKIKRISEMKDDETMVTRRVITNPEQWMIEYDGEDCYCEDKYGDRHKVTDYARYHVGEVVYIKEAWATDSMFDNMSFKQILETKVATIPIWYKDNDFQEENLNTTQGRWRTPRFMPEYAARYFIKIKDVRAERLDDITYGDCMAEGLDMSDVDYRPGWDVSKYKLLWDSINKEYPFESDPWVFRYEFSFDHK